MSIWVISSSLVPPKNYFLKFNKFFEVHMQFNILLNYVHYCIKLTKVVLSCNISDNLEKKTLQMH